MARYEFRLPDVGEGVAEAEITAWHVAVGDAVAEDQPIADVMTDKATVEMESPVAGRVVELGGAVGDRVPVRGILVVLETEGEEPAPLQAEPESEVAAAVPTKVPPSPVPGKNARVAAAPAVRKRARDLGIDLSEIPAADGERIRHADLDAYLSARSGPAAVPPAERPLEPGDETVRVIGLRRRIADAMQESKRRIPHFSYVEEVDVTHLEERRAALNANGGEHLTILPFLVSAICRALADFPQINATYDDVGETVTRHAAVHMGIATQTDAGLMVPVIRDAHTLGLRALAREIAATAEAARSGTLGGNRLSGSTITISSLGPLGGIVSTPVINRPEVAIVAVNRIVERPMVVNGEIAIRKMMNLSSSFDHRVVDGWDAARFIQRVKAVLESTELGLIAE